MVSLIILLKILTNLFTLSSTEEYASILFENDADFSPSILLLPIIIKWSSPIDDVLLSLNVRCGYSFVLSLNNLKISLFVFDKSQVLNFAPKEMLLMQFVFMIYPLIYLILYIKQKLYQVINNKNKKSHSGGFCYLLFSCRWVRTLSNPFPAGDNSIGGYTSTSTGVNSPYLYKCRNKINTWWNWTQFSIYCISWQLNSLIKKLIC